jgi:hypothetical protein
MCAELGIEKHEYYIYHKSHIKQVMAVAITGYAFDGSPANGGDGLKIGIYRVQAARIEKRSNDNRTEMPLAYYDTMVLFYAEKETAILSV